MKNCVRSPYCKKSPGPRKDTQKRGGEETWPNKW